MVLDVDSTLCGIEGIDWLAAKRGADVALRVAELTESAMRGELKLEDVYGERLKLVSPTADDIDDLAHAYVGAIAPGAREHVSKWISSGIRVALVSGGIRQAIVPVAASLGLPPESVHAVSLDLTNSGDYAGFDASSPLSVATGKRDIVRELQLPAPVIAIGDGATDVYMREVTDCFVAFTGFAKRAAVIEASDFTAATFAELDKLVTGS